MRMWRLVLILPDWKLNKTDILFGGSPAVWSYASMRKETEILKLTTLKMWKNPVCFHWTKEAFSQFTKRLCKFPSILHHLFIVPTHDSEFLKVQFGTIFYYYLLVLSLLYISLEYAFLKGKN